MKDVNEQEFEDLLKRWEVPKTPASLRENALKAYRRWQKRNWLWLLTGYLPVPFPMVSLAVVLIIGLGVAILLPKNPAPPLPPRIIASKVEVPVIRERIITKTVYLNKMVPDTISINLREFQPVASLNPRVIRSHQDGKEK